MIIDCISDLHGFYPKLEGGDLLIVAGDLTAHDEIDEYCDFFDWLVLQNYSHKILIAGNHDNKILDGLDFSFNDERIHYLQDSGVEIDGLKIWGSPWTAAFEGMNPHCMAFTESFGVDTEEWLAEHWALIPDDTDILITHSPPILMLDRTVDGKFVGSVSLSAQIGFLTNLKLHVFGHIHESYGKIEPPDYLPDYFDVSKHYSINVSHVNEHYKPVNKPIRIEL